MRILRKIGWRFTVVLGLSGLVACATPTKLQEIPATNEQNFLEKLYALARHPPLSVEKISTSFGWKVTETIRDSNKNFTYFDDHPHRGKLKPNFVWDDQSGPKSFTRYFSKPSFCIRSADVLAEFGENFKSTLSLVSPPIVDFIKLSEVEKSDYKLFELGPKYLVNGNGILTEIYFQFFYSECAYFVTTTNLNDSTK